MAIHDFKSQRLFVDHDLAADRAMEATREQTNYLLNVLRLQDESGILIFNGRDGEWLARIEVNGRKKCNLIPIEQIRTQPEPYRLVYCFAPLKQARLDYMVQKAVEMGVGVLQPVLTQYTQVRSLKDRRIFSNAVEAAEQCGIISLPEIRAPIKLPELQKHLHEDALLVFCDEAAVDARELEGLSADPNRQIALLIGPEGGFSDEERAMIEALPHTARLGLGPRVLRADTAAVAALAVIQSKLGDWYGTDSETGK